MNIVNGTQASGLDPLPESSTSPDRPSASPLWLWALQEGWQLAKRRPSAWLMAVVLFGGSGVAVSALRDALGPAVGGWGRLGFQVGLAFVAWVWGAVTFLRIMAGELGGSPLSWRQAQAWSFARIGRCWSFWIRGAILLAGGVLLTALAVAVALPFHEPVDGARMVNPVAFRVALPLGGVFLGTRLANLASYYVVQGSGFRASLRLAWRESGPHWGSYLALTMLAYLPSMPLNISTLSTPSDFDFQQSPWWFVSTGLGSLIHPWFIAAWLHLWLRNGEGADLALFEREL